jgi:hypothetical protein
VVKKSRYTGFLEKNIYLGINNRICCDNMDKEKWLLPGILIILVLILVFVAVSFSGNNQFQTGNVYFQYPSSWAQEQSMGAFNNQSLYSSVVLKKDFPVNNTTQTAYIVFQMQATTQGVIQIPSSGSIVSNTTNSTVGTIDTGGVKATQLGNYGPQIAQMITIIQKGNFYYTLQFVCPISAVQETQEAYNQILNTLKLN